jgi:ribosome-binding ATPase YchF (GTP1/OBG family)
VESTIHIYGNKKEPLVVELGSVSIPDKVTVQLKALEENKAYQLKVKNKVEGEVRYNGQVKLTTNYPEKPELMIRVSANMRPAIELRPKALSFGRIPAERLDQLSKQGRALKRPIMVVLNKGDDLKVNKVESEKSLFKAVTKEMSKGKMTQVLIEPVFENLQKGPNEDHIKIFTNQKGNEVLKATVRFEVL